MRLMTLLLFVTFSASCFHRPPNPKPPEPECLIEPPPVMRPVLASPCPNGLTVCLDTPNAAALTRNVLLLRRWVEEAWARCGTR
jgi:hypothetical protein